MDLIVTASGGCRSPDGTRLVTGRDGPYGGGGGIGEVVVRDARTGKELLNLMQTAFFSSVVYSPHVKRLASGSGNPSTSQSGEVKMWDAVTGQELLTLKERVFGKQFAFSSSGHWLVSNAGGTVKIYDATPLPEKP